MKIGVILNSKVSPKIFFGWWTNIVTAILTGLVQVFTIQGSSALFKPISSEFGLSRAKTSITSEVGVLLNGIIFFLAGWLSDKFGSKRIIISGACIAGTSMMLLAFVTTLGLTLWSGASLSQGFR